MHRLYETELTTVAEPAASTDVVRSVHTILSSTGAIPKGVLQLPAPDGQVALEAQLAAPVARETEAASRWLLRQFAGSDPEWTVQGSELKIQLHATVPSDPMDLLGIGYREDSYSDLIAQAFRYHPAFRQSLLSTIGFARVAADWQCRSRPTVFAKDGRTIRSKAVPDLVLFSKRERALVVIENKILAGEGHLQTVEYAEDTVLNRLAKDLEVEHATTELVYLTLDGQSPRQPFKGKTFRPMSYERMLTWLPEVGGSPLADLLANLRRRIQELCDWPAPTNSSHPHSYLATHFGLVTDMRVFRNLCALIAPPRAAYPRSEWGATNNLGGRALYTWWAGDNWTSETRDECGQSVHIELQWAPGGNALTLFLHHEPYPYATQAELKQHPRRLRAHNSNRREFLAKLRPRVAALRAAGWSTRVGKCEFSVSWGQ